jgi:hypothetical protein
MSSADPRAAIRWVEQGLIGADKMVSAGAGRLRHDLRDWIPRAVLRSTERRHLAEAHGQAQRTQQSIVRHAGAATVRTSRPRPMRPNAAAVTRVCRILVSACHSRRTGLGGWWFKPLQSIITSASESADGMLVDRVGRAIAFVRDAKSVEGSRAMRQSRSLSFATACEPAVGSWRRMRFQITNCASVPNSLRRYRYQ